MNLAIYILRFTLDCGRECDDDTSLCCRYLEERLAEQELEAHERELEKQKAAQEKVKASENDAAPGASEPVTAS